MMHAAKAAIEKGGAIHGIKHNDQIVQWIRYQDKVYKNHVLFLQVVSIHILPSDIAKWYPKSYVGDVNVLKQCATTLNKILLSAS